MRTRSAIGAAILAAGTTIAITSFAHAASTIEVQVSRALQEDWHSSINAAPGDSIDIRVRISHTGGGSQTPLGFSSVIFQPTVSNWQPGQDSLAAFVNNGIGSQYTTPIGAVFDAPGQYGRLAPHATRITTNTNYLKGHVNTVSGTTYLRIAQSQVTNWFGLSGNTSGGSGINMHQANSASVERSVAGNAFPFTGALTDLVMFKFNITLGASTDLRTLLLDVPIAGINRHDVGIQPYVGWYMTPTEDVGSFQDRALTIVPATILVPAPGATLAVAAGVLLATRRKR